VFVKSGGVKHRLETAVTVEFGDYQALAEDIGQNDSLLFSSEILDG